MRYRIEFAERAMLKLKPQYITKSGRREFVVLTVKDYQKLTEALEDAEDSRILRKSKRRQADAPTISLDEMKRRLGMKTPRRAKAG
jgi:prevent-host-death family protein